MSFPYRRLGTIVGHFGRALGMTVAGIAKERGMVSMVLPRDGSGLAQTQA